MDEHNFHILMVINTEGGAEFDYVNAEDHRMSLETARTVVAELNNRAESAHAHPYFNTSYFVVYGRD